MASEQDILVLREMVRLAENRRTEELTAIERVNKYNLALIGFSGAFLSLLVTGDFSVASVQIAGALNLLSIAFSFFTIRPRILKGGSLTVIKDVTAMKSDAKPVLNEYLLTVADLTDQAATAAGALAVYKRKTTIYSAIFLACALIVTYILYAYA